MDKPRLNVMLIEDDEDDFILVRSFLADAPTASFHLDWVDSYEAGLEALCRGDHDAYLLDYRLGERNGLELMREAGEEGCSNRAIILLTGQGGYEVDIEAMRAGASDYLVKGQITADLLERSIRYSMDRKKTEEALREARDRLEFRVRERTAELARANDELRVEITERRQAEEALRESEERYRVLVQSALDIIYTVSAEGIIESLNPAFETITGWPSSEWTGKHFASIIHSEDLDFLLARFKKALNGEMLPSAGIRVRCKSGAYRILEFKTVPRSLKGKVVGVVGTARDITDRKAAEEKVTRQNEFLQSVLESLAHPFYVLDANDYTIQMANSAAAPRGLPPHATCHALTHREERPCNGPEHLCPLEEIKKTKQPTIVEHLHYDPNGKPIYVEVHSYPILGPSGEVIQIIEYSLDITERKKMEDALRKARDELEVRVRERTAELARANEDLRAEIEVRRKVEEALRLDEARFEALLELSQMNHASIERIAAFALEQQVKLTKSSMGSLGFMNEDETILTLHAWSRNVMAECNVLESKLHYPIEQGGIWADAVRKRKPIIVNDYSIPDPYKKGYPNGHVPLKRLLSVPVFEGDHIVAVAIVANKESDYDTSDVRQLTLLLDGMWKLVQREAAQKSLREAESLAAMGRALSGVAHDMKTPLIAIGGFTRLVQKHLEPDSPDREKLEIVLKETLRLENMVKDMLDFSRPLELERSREDIGRVLRESLAVIESLAEERKVMLEIRSEQDVPRVLCDSMRMKQVFINLILNAIQASEEGGTVTIVHRLDATHLVIDVRDEGCGVPADKRKEIFSPFFTTKREGTGLGLPIVKKIIEAHRGGIEIVDNPDRGVTFRVTIPVQ